jgi:hypothetical protein
VEGKGSGVANIGLMDTKEEKRGKVIKLQQYYSILSKTSIQSNIAIYRTIRKKGETAI